MIMVEFGAKLKGLRRGAGLTQKQLAERLGITASVVSYYELATRTPSPDVLIKLSGIFHISVDELLGLEHPQPFPLDISGLSDADIDYLRQTIEILKRKKR